MKPFKPPAPVATRVIVVACVVIECALLIAGPRLNEHVALTAGLIPARVTGRIAGLPGSVPAPLTLLTSMFLHAGLLHLFFNMTFLAWVGRYVEWVVGRWRFVGLYLAGGIAGGLLQVAVSPSSIVPVVGASGAISAVFGAYAVLFARSRASERRVLGLSVSSDAMTALWYASVWIGLQLAMGLVFNASSGSTFGIGGIAIWTHIGGFVTGLLFAQPFVRGAPRID